MDVMLWRVKGHKGIQLNLEELKRKEYSFDEIKKEEENIVLEVEECIKDGGEVFALIKKNTIKLLYTFNKDEDGTLKIDKKIVLDDTKKCVKEFENDLHTILRGVVYNRFDITKAVWKNKNITKKEKFINSITTIKIFAWFGIVACTMLGLAMLVCGTTYTYLGLENYTMADMQKDEMILNFVSDVNNYNYSETVAAAAGYKDAFGFALVEMLLPTLVMVSGYILLVISLINVLKLVKHVKDTKTLFTFENNMLVKKITILLFVGLLFLIQDFLLWLGIGLILEVFVYIFNYCVQVTVRNN